MAVSTGYDQSIRSLLNQNNIDNSRISYNPTSQTVQVDGRDFMKAPKVYNNTAYTNQQGFNTALDAFKKPKVDQNPGVTAGASAAQYGANTGSSSTSQPSTPSYTSPYQPQKNPVDDQYSQLLNALMNQIQHPTPVDANAIYQSPQYAAYQAQAQRGAHDAIRAAQESMGASGFGRSSALAERSQGIQNDANTYLNSQVLPQLIAQEQASRNQQLQNQFGLLDSLYGQQQLYDTRGQNAESNALQRGQLTGSYLSPEMQQLYDAVLQDKSAYAGAATPEERQAIRSDADALRKRIYAMGGDPSLVGSDVTLSQAGGNAPRFGVQTLGSREQDRADQNQALNETQVMAALTGFLPDGTPTTEQQQRDITNLWAVADQTGIIPDALADMYGLPHGTQTRAAYEFAKQLAISQQQANTSSYNAATSRLSAKNSNENADANTKLNRDKFDYEKQQDELAASQPPQDKPLTYEEAYKDIDNSMFLQREEDENGNPKTVVTNPSGLEDYIFSLDLPEADTKKLYRRYGLKWGD